MRPLLAAALLLLLAGCEHAQGLAKRAQERSREDQRAELQRAIELFEQNLAPGGAPDAPGLIRLASDVLTAHGVEHTFTGRPGDLALTIAPALDTGLNRVALQVRDGVGGVTVYDVGDFLQRPPGTTARFDADARTLYLSHQAITELSANEPSVRHELVHVHTWSTIRAGWPTPYAVWLSGEGLPAEGLFLDEMNASSEDVRFAAFELQTLLQAEPDPASPVARAELELILQARVSGQVPQLALGRLERLWDRIVTGVVLGGSYTFAAQDVLPAVAAALNQPDRVRYEATEAGVFANIEAPAALAGKGAILLHARAHLPGSKGAEDPANPALLRKQLTSSVAALRKHGEQFTRAKAELHAIVNEISPGVRAERLMEPKRLAGDL